MAFVSRLEQVTDEVCGTDEGNALSTTRRLDANGPTAAPLLYRVEPG